MLVTLFCILGCSKSEENNKNESKDIELIAICSSEVNHVETYNNIENKVTLELYAKNNKLIKITKVDTYVSPTYEEYKESIAIDYNRKAYESSKNTDGMQYEYTDDYTNLTSTYKITYIISKLTYAEKDEIRYQSMLDEYGEMMSFDKIVELYENNGGEYYVTNRE